MKNLLFILLLSPLLAFTQTVVETVKLKNDKFATLYDDGTWVYTSVPTPSVSSNKTDIKGTISPVKTSNSERSTAPTTSSYSSTCGARTKAGGSCKRVVKGGGRCWQH